MAVTQTFTKFYCFGPKEKAGSTTSYTVMVEGSQVGSSCVIAATATKGANESAGVTIKAGQVFDVRVTTGALEAGQTAHAAWALAP